MYSEKVMDHFEHPRNVGEIENASAGVFETLDAMVDEKTKLLMLEAKEHLFDKQVRV